MGKSTGEAKARRLVYGRSMRAFDTSVPMCEVCGVRRSESWHHRRNRSQGGLWLPSNGLAVCGDGTTGDHGALTNTNGRRGYYEWAGWIVPSWQDPGLVKVRHAALGWVLLDDTGNWAPTEPPESPAEDADLEDQDSGGDAAVGW